MDGMHNVTKGPSQYPHVVLNNSSLIYMIADYYLYVVYISPVFGMLPLLSIFEPRNVVMIIS